MAARRHAYAAWEAQGPQPFDSGGEFLVFEVEARMGRLAVIDGGHDVCGPGFDVARMGFRECS